MIDTEKLIDGFTASALFLKDEKSNETLKSMTIKKFYKKDQNANEFEKYFQTEDKDQFWLFIAGMEEKNSQCNLYGSLMAMPSTKGKQHRGKVELVNNLGMFKKGIQKMLKERGVEVLENDFKTLEVYYSEDLDEICSKSLQFETKIEFESVLNMKKAYVENVLSSIFKENLEIDLEKDKFIVDYLSFDYNDCDPVEIKEILVIKDGKITKESIELFELKYGV
tara:strand:+ start:4757 stop:5425 length:669 start_codon:yes stop_codon:yes gene_type:complete